MDKKQDSEKKRGFGGSFLLFLLGVVLIMMVLQTWRGEKEANVAFSYQLENLVNLDLVQPKDSTKVALNDNLVTFYGKFREEKTQAGEERYQFLQVLDQQHKYQEQIANAKTRIANLRLSIIEAADWFLHLSGFAIPAGGYVVVDSTYDVGGSNNKVVITQLSDRKILGIKQLKSQLSSMSTTPSQAEITQLHSNLSSVLLNFRSNNLAIGSEKMKDQLHLLSNEALSIENSPAPLASKGQKYANIVGKLEALALQIGMQKDGLRLVDLRPVRSYKASLALLATALSQETIGREHLQKAQFKVADAIWFFNGKELTTKSLITQDSEAYNHWFLSAKKEWSSFAANKGLAFKAPDQPVNLVLEKRFKSQEPAPNYFGYLITLLPVALVLGLLYYVFARQMKGGGAGGAMNFGKAPARMLNKEDIHTTFQDVAGIDEAKEELEEIVEFLKNPEKFTQLGAQIPKGVLCVGAPGTGKTLIARAVAGEADRPFFSISGSDFVEMFVGVGASRIRDLFAQAKKNAPCIIFIDEIDAVGRHRGGGVGGGHDEREQTLNQLLVEMDGFDANEGVIIMAATNRPDVLDKALLRPGRFDRRIMIELPDVRGRFEILKVHAKKIKMDPSVDLMQIARATPGSSGADLKNILNESALVAASRNRTAVTSQDTSYAVDKVRFGKERRSLELTENDRKTTAYHESGHAIIGLVVSHADPVEKVTIVPRGPSLGATHFLPEKNRLTYWKNELIDQLAICMGGRIAEEIFVGDMSSGAQQDLQQATHIARNMVCKWGMSNLGIVAYDDPTQDGQYPWAGHQERTYSEETAKRIDSEVRNYLDAAYTRAKEIIEANKDKIELMTDLLMQFETLYKAELDILMETGELSAEKVKERITAQEQKFVKPSSPPPVEEDKLPHPDAPPAPGTA